MTGSMARYVQKYFITYVNKNCVKDNFLGDSPVPSNAIFSPPAIDNFVEDLIGDQKALRFMKRHDNSLKFIQRKVSLIMGSLFKI